MKSSHHKAVTKMHFTHFTHPVIVCQMIDKMKGIRTIVELLNLENLPVIVPEERTELKKIILSCLLNLLTVKPEYQAIAISHGLLELLADTLEVETGKLVEGSLVSNCVLILFCFLDNEASVEHLRNYRICFALIDQLRRLNLKQLHAVDQVNELDLATVESILDLLMHLVNSEEETKSDFKLKLVDRGLVELLIEMLDHPLIEDEPLLKTASNLAVTLVSHKSIAKKYYNAGKGTVYLQAKRWLDEHIEALAGRDEDELIASKENLIQPNADSIEHDSLIEKHDSLKQKAKPKDPVKENNQLVTSALMIGNFSSNNEDSILIAKDGLIEKLVTIVESTEDFSIQFACLSSLRNLAIPEPNKSHFISNGLLSRLLRLNHSDSATVVFKYLATLRLIADRQPAAAIEIIANHKLIENLKTWGNLTNMTGVKAEASRLLASLFKNLETAAGLNTDHLMNGQLLRLLFEMVNSEHLKMQNEAVNGIGFLINKFEWNQLVSDLLNDDAFSKNVKHLVRSHCEKEELSEFELKFMQNVLSVLTFGRLKYQLNFDRELLAELESLSTSHPTLAMNVKMFLDFKQHPVANSKC